jgi:hypothetical protein
MPQPLDKCRSRAARLVLLGVLCLGLTLAAAGQGADAGPVHYFNERNFEIPFLSSNPSVTKVRLWASSNGGPYSQVATALPSQRAFQYNAPGDGWYSFVVQVQDVEGRLNPANVNQFPPFLQVCVDTERPQVVLRPVLPQKGTVGVEWQVSDKNLDLRTLRLAYRLAGSPQWTGLNIQQLVRAQFSWTTPAAGNYEVRLTVADRAGNTSTATTQVRATSGGAPGQLTSSAPGGPRVKHVASKTFQLNYKIDNVGPSRVKHVEVWMTRDTQQWMRYKGDAPPVGPFELTVASAGRYGFTLRPCSGVGRAPKAPDIGQQPQLWVQVDETKPLVKIQHVVVGEGQENGTFTVHYTATDAHLRAKPISVLYSTGKEGPWTELLTEQENTGACRCQTRDLPFEFYLRVQAVDEAGNKGFDQFAETVKVDTLVPRVQDVDVEAVDPGAKRLP